MYAWNCFWSLIYHSTYISRFVCFYCFPYRQSGTGLSCEKTCCHITNNNNNNNRNNLFVSNRSQHTRWLRCLNFPIQLLVLVGQSPRETHDHPRVAKRPFHSPVINCYHCNRFMDWLTYFLGLRGISHQVRCLEFKSGSCCMATSQVIWGKINPATCGWSQVYWNDRASFHHNADHHRVSVTTQRYKKNWVKFSENYLAFCHMKILYLDWKSMKVDSLPWWDLALTTPYRYMLPRLNWTKT